MARHHYDIETMATLLLLAGGSYAINIKRQEDEDEADEVEDDDDDATASTTPSATSATSASLTTSASVSTVTSVSTIISTATPTTATTTAADPDVTATSTTTASTSTSTSTTSHAFDQGTKGGIAIGVLVGLIAMAGAFWMYLRSRRRRRLAGHSQEAAAISLPPFSGTQQTSELGDDDAFPVEPNRFDEKGHGVSLPANGFVVAGNMVVHDGGASAALDRPVTSDGHAMAELEVPAPVAVIHELPAEMPEQRELRPEEWFSVSPATTSAGTRGTSAVTSPTL